MNITVKNKIASGVWGTVFYGKCGTTDCVIKVEKYNHDTSYNSPFVREVDFANFARRHQPIFMQLIYYSVIENCDHEQPIPDDVSKSFRRQLVQYNKLSACSMLGYTPIMKHTWKAHPPTSELDFLTRLYHVVESIDLMRSAGFIHNDIHDENIMYNPESSRWCLVDYGNLQYTENPDYMYDLIRLLFMVVENKYGQRLIKYNKKPTPYLTFLNTIVTNKPVYKDIKQYLPKTKNKFLLEDCTILVCLILHYAFYMEALGCKNIKKYADDISVQKYPELFLYMIAHVDDANYRDIKNEIKKYIRRSKKS